MNEADVVDAALDELDALRQTIARDAADLATTFAAISEAARINDRRALSSAFVFFGAEVAELSALLGQFEALSRHRSKAEEPCAQPIACVPMWSAGAEECEAAARRSPPEALETVRQLITHTNDKLAHERLLWAVLVHSLRLHIWEFLARGVPNSPMANWLDISAKHATQLLHSNTTIEVAWSEGLKRVRGFAGLPPKVRERGLEALVAPPNWTDKRQEPPTTPAYSVTTHLTDLLLLAGLVVVDPMLSEACSEEEREMFVDGAVVGWAAEIERWTDADRKEVDEWAKSKVLGAETAPYPAQLFQLPLGKSPPLRVGDRVQRVFELGGAVDGAVVATPAPFMAVIEIESARGTEPTRIEQHASRWRITSQAGCP